MSQELLFGSVAYYEPERGLGVVLSNEGAEHLFHCTAISDGSRQIEVGRAVCFRLVPAHGGRYEAAALTKLA